MCGGDPRFGSQLVEAGPGVAEVISAVPFQENPPLSSDWLRSEMLERFQVIRPVEIDPGTRVLEVGAGAHAISTVPLAYRVGAQGRVVAVERERWTHFREVVHAVGLADRILPLTCDARRLPFRSNVFELGACIHGIRSLRSEGRMVEVFQEMLRVAPRILLAESLPLARNPAQRAHLAMYDLRQEIFEALNGVPDDLHYLSLDRLVGLVERAGGSVLQARVVEVDLPHALAYLPRAYVQRVPDPQKREDLLHRWDGAEQLRRRYGADHPPVGVIVAEVAY